MADMLPHEVQLDLFRICQEAMTNIMDHSGAQSASISFDTTPKEIILIIADNGRGFHLRKLKHTPGLDNMRKQAALVKGKLTIDTAVGKGTRILLNIDKQNVI
jgi:signal transduction histidine kinase